MASRNQNTAPNTQAQPATAPQVQTLPDVTSFSVPQLRQLVENGLNQIKSIQQKNMAESAEISNELKALAGIVGVSPEPAPEVPPVATGRRGRPVGSVNKKAAGDSPKKGRAVPGSDKTNEWTLKTGTRELLCRYDDKGGLTKKEFPDKFRKDLKFTSTAKDDTSFANSIYVSGINKLRKDGHCVQEENGKYKLTKEGMKVALAYRKEREKQQS